MQHFDVIIVGAGPGGIFSAYELSLLQKDLSIAVLERGGTLNERKCPISIGKVSSCINCPTCSIMNGFGGAGAFSDGKFDMLPHLKKSGSMSTEEKLLWI